MIILPREVPLQNGYSGVEIQLQPDVLHTVLGSSFQPRLMSVVYSGERAPLTWFAHLLAVSAAKSDTEVAFIDSGTNYSSASVRALSSGSELEVLARIHVARILGLESLVDLIDDMAVLGPRLVIIDSLTGALNLSGGPYSKESNRRFFAALDALRCFVNDNDSTVVFTDHSTKRWSDGTRRPAGGNILAHAVDSVVYIASVAGEEMNEYVKVHIERAPSEVDYDAVIIRLGPGGIRSIRSET